LNSPNTPAQAFAQVLDDHQVLASIGSVGDAYDTQSRMRFLLLSGSL